MVQFWLRAARSDVFHESEVMRDVFAIQRFFATSLNADSAPETTMTLSPKLDLVDVKGT